VSRWPSLRTDAALLASPRRCLSRLVVLYAAANRAAALRHPDKAEPPLMAAELGHRRPPLSTASPGL